MTPTPELCADEARWTFFRLAQGLFKRRRMYDLAPHASFFVLAAVLLWPDRSGAVSWRLLVLAVVIEVIAGTRAVLANTDHGRKAAGDVAAILFVFLLGWHDVATDRLNIVDAVLIPSPEAILKLFFSELRRCWSDSGDR